MVWGSFSGETNANRVETLQANTEPPGQHLGKESPGPAGGGALRRKAGVRWGAGGCPRVGGVTWGSKRRPAGTWGYMPRDFFTGSL